VTICSTTVHFNVNELRPFRSDISFSSFCQVPNSVWLPVIQQVCFTV